jgi:drug/metabolite transporter (DMT)-like permease
VPFVTDNFRASILMIVTMLGFAGEDLFIKLVSARLPMGQILLIVGTGGVAAMFALAKLNRVRLLDPALLAPSVLVRTAAELGTQVFGFAALAALPLSLVTAIGQAAPIASTLGAALFLGEMVGWRRWSAIGVGLVGVLLILRPGTEGFQPEMIFAALAMLCVAVRDLATRRVPAELQVMQLNFWGYATTLPSGLLLLTAQGAAPVWPSATDWLLLVAALSLGFTFYWTLTLALRMGESSVVVPYRYTRLVWALILSATVLGEHPAPTMLAGTALVVGSGLYTLLREARLRHRRRLRPSPGPVAPI